MRIQRLPRGWQVRFTTVGSDWVFRVCTFADDDKIISMWHRFAGATVSADVHVFEFAVVADFKRLVKITVKAETIQQRAMWGIPFQKRRCIHPTDSTNGKNSIRRRRSHTSGH